MCKNKIYIYVGLQTIDFLLNLFRDCVNHSVSPTRPNPFILLLGYTPSFPCLRPIDWEDLSFIPRTKGRR